MSTDVEVVEVGSSNSLLPNLTICVENEDDEGAVPEIEYENEKKDVTDEEMLEDGASIKPRLNLFPRKKIYENKSMGGALELGLSFEEAEKRRKRRAERFKSPLIEATSDEKDDDIEEFVKQAEPYLHEINRFNESRAATDEEFIRTDSLHLMGVNEMSTEDIFAYFGKTNPRHIEWVDDTSCNVVWGDVKLASVAMEKVALPYSQEQKSEKESESRVKAATAYDDELDLLSEYDDSTMETNDPGKPKEVVDVPVNPVRKCREPFQKNRKKFLLEVRYAKGGDRKELFAAKKSKYYLKHGNPHYGGTKGLLTSTYRKRYQMKKAMKELRDLNVPPTRPRYRDYDGNAEEVAEKKRKMDVGEDQEMIKEDESLLRSSVKDLSGGSSSAESDSDEAYGSMVADQVSQRVAAAREMTGIRGGLSVTTSNNHIRARLGKREDWAETRKRRSPQRGTHRISADLRSRLGSKKRPEASSKSGSSGFPQQESRKRSDLAEDYSSPLTLSHEKTNFESSSRELTRYSPPPWE